MKVAIIAEPFVPIPPNKYGGIEQVIYFLIKGLKEAGHEPILIGPADSTVDCEILPTIGKSLPFPKAKKDLRKHTAQVKKAHRITARRIREIADEVDIIHSHGFDMLPFKDLPTVTTLHNSVQFYNIDYYAKRKDLPFVSISKNYQDAFPDLNYVGVVYNGEDPNEFPLVTKPEDYLCFLGRFDRDKNPHVAIELALSLGMKIKLAGKFDHKGEGYFEEEIQKYLNHPLVDYLGELGFEEKTELLANARCNLHPVNFREPFGLTVVEAAYCGTPTLAINKGAMSELIEHGRTGLLVEDFVEGYSHIKECFMMDRKYIASRARQLFNYETMTAQYIEAYEKVIEQIPSPRAKRGLIKQLLHLGR